jgi:hypothetical protein
MPKLEIKVWHCMVAKKSFFAGVDVGLPSPNFNAYISDVQKTRSSLKPTQRSILLTLNLKNLKLVQSKWNLAKVSYNYFMGVKRRTEVKRQYITIFYF